MRKFLIGFIAVVTMVIAGVLVVPGMIDWNDYKDEITSQVENASGRRLTIAGDISLSILPAPVVKISNVAFANIAGSEDPYMAKLDSLEVRVALLPLLGGTIQVEKIRLVDPVIILEVLPDGRKNWELDTPDQSKPSSAEGGQNLAPATPEPNGSFSTSVGPGVQLDNFELVNATVIYRDGPGGSEETINAISATFRMASLKGPFISEGSLIVRNTPLNFNIGIDGIYQGRTAPLKAEIKLADNLLTLAISGDLTNLDTEPKFTGKTRIQGASLASIIAVLVPGTTLPAPLTQGLDIQGDITSSSSELSIDELLITLGDISGTAKLNAGFSDITSASLNLRLGHIDLDKMLVQSLSEATQTISNQENTSPDQNNGKTPVAKEAANNAPLILPDNVNGALSILVEAITFNGQRSGEVIFNAELNQGEITLSQFSATLPGKTEFALFGFASAQDGTLSFEGDSELNITDGHKLAQWLGLDLATVRRGALKNIVASTTIMTGFKAENLTARLKKIDLKFGKSKLTGDVAIKLQQRLGLDINLSLDRLNLDDYLAPGVVGGSTSLSSGTTNQTTTIATDATAGSQSTSPGVLDNPLAPLQSLTQIDGTVKIRVGELVFNKTKARKIVLDANLRNNNLTLNKVQVGDVAGARIAVSGSLSALHKIPRFDNLKLDFKTKSMAGLARAFDITLPIPAKTIGAVNLSTVLNGPPLQPAIKTSLSALGANLSLAGKLSVLPTHPPIDLDIALKHGSLAKLIRISGSDYRSSGKIGGLDVSLHAKGGLTKVNLTNIKGVTGKISFNGSTSMSLGNDRPQIVAILNTGPVVLDPYIPAGGKSAPSSATSSQSPPPPPGTSGASGASGATGAPWSHDKIDLSGLQGFDADVIINSTTVHHEKIQLKNAKLSAVLDKGILNIRQISSSLFGGQINASAILDARNIPNLTTTVTANNIQVKNLLNALSDKDIATGIVSLKSSLAATGSSVADLVAAMNGDGSFDARAIDVKGSAKGTPLAGILGIVRGLGQIGSSLSGKSSSALADASGSFTLKNGVASLQNMILRSGLGDGELEGNVDLPAWQLDVNGTMHMTKNILTQVLSLNTGIMQDFPFSVSGSMDDPTIKFSTGSKAGTNPKIPLVGDVPVIGTVLEGVLGGLLGKKITRQPPPQPAPTAQDQGQDSSQPPPPPSQQPQPQQQQELNPADLIKNLLKF